jgi:hypothetical protein
MSRRSTEEIAEDLARHPEPGPERDALMSEYEEAVLLQAETLDSYPKPGLPQPKDEDTPGRGVVDIESGRQVPAGKPLRGATLSLSVETLRAKPPRRDFLLTDTRTLAGVLVRGRVGLIAARGGTGKTIALVGLAVANAAGSEWFGPGGWQTARGRVLLLLAEEDAPEVLRRLHHAALAAGVIADDNLAALAANVTVLPLYGQGVALTTEIDPTTAALPETPRAEELREILRGAAREGRPYSLVILDPLARFAGADVEKDNAAATRFVQVVETFTSEECGGPNVLGSHHWRKTGKDDDTDSANPIRGASALVDGVRWAATIERLKHLEGAPDLLRLRVVKTNYAPAPEPLILCRPGDGHGCLRAATPEEVAAYQARGAPIRRFGVSREERLAALRPEIIAALRKKPGSGSDLATRLHARKEIVGDACRELELDGQIRRQDGARSSWCLAESTVPGTVPGPEPSPQDQEFPSSHTPVGGGNRELSSPQGTEEGVL